MCSIGFAPKSGGEVPPYDFVPLEPKRLNISEDAVNAVKIMARDFWVRVASDERISDEFKDFLKRGNPIDLM